MKKRLTFLAWFGFAALVCLMCAGLYLSGVTNRMRWLVFGIGSAVAAVCALIGIVFPEKMTRLFFGVQGRMVRPGRHRGGVVDKLHGEDVED